MESIRTFLQDKPYQHIIWDWNGTLLNDLEVCVDIISQTAQKYGLSPVSKRKYLEAFRFPITQFYLSLGFNFQKTPFTILADEFIQSYRARVLECSLFDQVDQFLHHSQKQGISHSVLSAAAETDLKHLLCHFQIDHYFDHIYGIHDHFADGKLQRGLQLMQDSKIPPNQTILIGDTDHDLEVAKRLGVSALLVARGHQCYTKLSKIHSWVLNYE